MHRIECGILNDRHKLATHLSRRPLPFVRAMECLRHGDSKSNRPDAAELLVCGHGFYAGIACASSSRGTRQGLHLRSLRPVGSGLEGQGFVVKHVLRFTADFCGELDRCLEGQFRQQKLEDPFTIPAGGLG